LLRIGFSIVDHRETLSGVEEGKQVTYEQVEKAEEIKDSMMTAGRTKGGVMEDVTSI
jgi:hypothetical protein